jgi:hypothetical protein
MLRKMLMSVAILACTALTATAAPTIMAGNHALLPNTPGQIVPILASGTGTSENTAGVDLFLVVGGGTTGPIVTGLDVIGAGTIFNGNNNGQQGFGPAYDPPSRELVGLVSTVSGAVDPNGVLAYLTVDTTGLTSGSFALSLTNETLGPSILYTTGGASTVLIDGTLSIVPEPSSIAMGLCAAVGLALVAIRRRRSA